jgi:hypothetical protein
MDNSLRDHISHLEKRIRDLNAQLLDLGRTLAECNRIRSEIRVAELALLYYRHALELERQVS